MITFRDVDFSPRVRNDICCVLNMLFQYISPVTTGAIAIRPVTAGWSCAANTAIVAPRRTPSRTICWTPVCCCNKSIAAATFETGDWKKMNH